MRLRVLTLTGFLLVAGCGGGSTVTMPAQPTSTPAPTTGHTQMPTAKLTLTIPRTAKPSSNLRRPQYVSPSTTQLTVTINSINGNTANLPPSQTTTLTSTGTNPNCTVGTGSETCTIAVLAPPGNVNYTFTAGDGTNTLSTSTTTLTIAAGTQASLSVSLQGVVNTVSIGAVTLVPTATTPTQPTLTVTALDADGNQIVGNDSFSSPVTLTDTDAHGATGLSLNGAAAATSVMITKPSDMVTLTYSGIAINNFTISATGDTTPNASPITVTPNDIVFQTGTGLFNDTIANGGQPTDPNFGQQTVDVAPTTPGGVTVSASEAGFTDGAFGGMFDIMLSAQCVTQGLTVVSSAGPATAFTISAANATTGTCSVRLTEHGTGYPLTNHPANVTGTPTHDGTFWVVVV